MYNNYEEAKSLAYKAKSQIYLRMIKVLPALGLRVLFPVVNFINPKRKAKVLDVGSGSGLYSFILREKFQCDCLEIEPFLSNYYGNSEVVKTQIMNYHLSEKYDLILLIDVIEHFDIWEAKQIIQKLKGSLNADGSIIIKVPNMGSLSGLESCFGDLTHKTHYNLISITALFDELDLKPIRVRGVSSNFKLSRMMMRLLALPYTVFLWLYLKSHGCSGVLTQPSIMMELRGKN